MIIRSNSRVLGDLFTLRFSVSRRSSPATSYSLLRFESSVRHYFARILDGARVAYGTTSY